MNDYIESALVEIAPRDAATAEDIETDAENVRVTEQHLLWTRLETAGFRRLVECLQAAHQCGKDRR